VNLEFRIQNSESRIQKAGWLREYPFEATLTQIGFTAMLAVFCAWTAWRAGRRATP
jgi:hypothetical protein